MQKVLCMMSATLSKPHRKNQDSWPRSGSGAYKSFKATSKSTQQDGSTLHWSEVTLPCGGKQLKDVMPKRSRLCQLPEHGIYMVRHPAWTLRDPQEIEDLSHDGEDQAKTKWYDQDGPE